MSSYNDCTDPDEDYGDEYIWWDEYEEALDEQGGIYGY